jgi:hypothetical protein
MPGPGRGDRQRLTLRPAVTELETVLVSMQPLPGHRLQRFHLLRRMRRPDVLDVAGPAPIRVHDLHRGRVTRRLHRPDKRHSHRLNNHGLVPIPPTKTPSQEPLQRRNPRKWHRSGRTHEGSVRFPKQGCAVGWRTAAYSDTADGESCRANRALCLSKFVDQQMGTAFSAPGSQMLDFVPKPQKAQACRSARWMPVPFAWVTPSWPYGRFAKRFPGSA